MNKSACLCDHLPAFSRGISAFCISVQDREQTIFSRMLQSQYKSMKCIMTENYREKLTTFWEYLHTAALSRENSNRGHNHKNVTGSLWNLKEEILPLQPKVIKAPKLN